MKQLSAKLPAGVAFTAASGHLYYYSFSKRLLLACHPILFRFISLRLKNEDPAVAVTGRERDRLFIESVGWVSKVDFDYYLRKLRHLERQGYFIQDRFDRRFITRLKPTDVKKNLANTTHVVLEVTDACNLQCVYCGYGKFYSDYDRRENKNLDPLVAKALLDYLAELWNSPLNTSSGRPITLGFYGGEPLLNFDFINEMVAYAKSLRLPRHRFRFAITTNAVLLKRHMDFLKRHQFNLLLSLDGNRKTNAYRVFKDGRSAFAPVVENALALQKEYPKYFREHVNFNAVFHNLGSVSSICRFFKARFNKTPSITLLNPIGINPDQKEAFWKLYASVLDNLKKTKNRKALSRDMFTLLPDIYELSWFIHLYADFVFDDYLELLFTPKPMKRLVTGTCVPFSRKVFLTVNGKILACERIGQQYTLGTAHPDAIDIDFATIARKYNRYFRHIEPICQTCYAAGHCMQCVYHMNLDTRSPSCDYLMKENEAAQYFSEQVSALEESPQMYRRILDEVIFE